MSVDSEILSSSSKNCFLLLGQSNMYGCGTIDREALNTDDRIQVYRDGKWETARQPLQKWDCKIYPEGGGSMGISFARRLLQEFPKAPINLVPCALGGSPIEQWLPGGQCYQNATTIAKEAVCKGELRAILWHQGESNSSEEDNAKKYFFNFKEVVESFRKDLNSENLPFIVGQLGEFMKDNHDFKYSHIVNEALRKACHQFPRMGFVSSEGLIDEDRNDKLHFGMKSLNEYGRRYAEKFVQCYMATVS